MSAPSAKPVRTPKRLNRPTLQPKTQASIDDQHSEAILGKLGEKSKLDNYGLLECPVRQCAQFRSKLDKIIPTLNLFIPPCLADHAG